MKLRLFTTKLFWATVLSVILTSGLIAPTINAADDESGNRFDFGFQHRTRFIDFENIIDYSDTSDDHNQFFRFRTRLWGQYTTPKLQLKLQLANEFRHYNDPDKDHSYDEIFVDQLYLKVNNLFDSNWSMSLGRQCIMRNNGFVFFDPSPLDGSRSMYFNALILTRQFESSQLEVFAISNPAEDEYLPIIGEKERVLNETDDMAFGAYYTSKRDSGTVLEASYMYKIEECPHSESSDAFFPDRNIHIVTGRASMPMGDAGTFYCEGGLASGEEDPDRSIFGWAGFAGYKHKMKGSLNPTFGVSAGAYSGDDPSTEKDEGWVQPFSRWAQWSEIYIYSLLREGGIAYWSNMWFANAECVIQPSDHFKLRFSYYKMMAMESADAPYSIFDTGKDRGDLFQVRSDFTLCKGLTGHAVYEYMLPGDFYIDDDEGHFLRFELNYAFSHGIDL